MSPIEFAMLRERVLDFLFEACPQLLLDDVCLEGVLYLVCSEVRRAVKEERTRLFSRLREQHAHRG